MHALTYAARRVRPRAGVLAVSAGVVFVAVGLLTVVAAYLAVVTDDGALASLREEDPERLVTVATQRLSPDRLAAADAALTKQFDAALGAGHQQWMALQSEAYGRSRPAPPTSTRASSPTTSPSASGGWTGGPGPHRPRHAFRQRSLREPLTRLA